MIGLYAALALAVLLVSLVFSLAIGRALARVSKSYPPPSSSELHERVDVDVLEVEDWGFRWVD